MKVSIIYFPPYNGKRTVNLSLCSSSEAEAWSCSYLKKVVLIVVFFSFQQTYRARSPVWLSTQVSAANKRWSRGRWRRPFWSSIQRLGDCRIQDPNTNSSQNIASHEWHSSTVGSGWKSANLLQNLQVGFGCLYYCFTFILSSFLLDGTFCPWIGILTLDSF